MNELLMISKYKRRIDVLESPNNGPHCTQRMEMNLNKRVENAHRCFTLNICSIASLLLRRIVGHNLLNFMVLWC